MEDSTVTVGDTTVEIVETDDGFEAVEVDTYSRRIRAVRTLRNAIEWAVAASMEPGVNIIENAERGITKVFGVLVFLFTATTLGLVSMVVWAVWSITMWLLLPKDAYAEHARIEE